MSVCFQLSNTNDVITQSSTIIPSYSGDEAGIIISTPLYQVRYHSPLQMQGVAASFQIQLSSDALLQERDIGCLIHDGENAKTPCAVGQKHPHHLVQRF